MLFKSNSDIILIDIKIYTKGQNMNKTCIFLLATTFFSPYSQTHNNTCINLFGLASNPNGTAALWAQPLPNTTNTRSIVAIYSEEETITHNTLLDLTKEFVFLGHDGCDLPKLKDTYLAVINQLDIPENRRSLALTIACVLLTQNKLSSIYVQPHADEPHVSSHSRSLEHIPQTYFFRSAIHGYTQGSEPLITTQDKALEMQTQDSNQPFHMIVNVKKWKNICNGTESTN